MSIPPSDNTTAIDKLADWIVGLQPEQVPASVQHIAITCLIDTLGVMIAGAASRVAAIARAAAADESGGNSGTCTVFGASRYMVASAAAFANGTAAHALDFDDNCYAGFVHGSAVIAPAALAVAQHIDASGRDLLTAFIVGSECEYAVGAASRSVLYETGWWTTGVLGPIGACAAAAWLLRLNRTQTAAALGLAVAAAGGLKAGFGTDAKALMAGRAAQAGVNAAMLARHGATGPAHAFEHHNGFARLFNQGVFDVNKLDRLGREWSLESPGVDIKRIPVCLSSHAAVDAALELLHENGFSLDEIASITCDVPPIVIANLVYQQPATRQEAQFSMQFAIAISLLYGTLGLEHLNPTALKDERVIGLMQIVDMHQGPQWESRELLAIAPEGAQVVITLKNGRRYERFRAAARGTAADPLSREEIEEKFLRCLAAGERQDGPILLANLHALSMLASCRALVPARGR